MRFFRGLAVPAAERETIMRAITARGVEQGRQWSMGFSHPGDVHALFSSPGVSLSDTRPESRPALPAICACGEIMGAAYYAFSHNRSAKDDTPVIIEFEAPADTVAVDGRDFLYTVFQMGKPERARPVLERAFGAAVLRYAERAWDTDDQQARIALCDLACYDASVVAAHHANTLALGGRHNTVFRNAFIVRLPVEGAAIVRVWSPSDEPDLPAPELTFASLLDR
jgi:hypothetical protein